MPTLSNVLAGFKKSAGNSSNVLSWSGSAPTLSSSINTGAVNQWMIASGQSPRSVGQPDVRAGKTTTNKTTKYIVYGKQMELTKQAVDYYNKLGVKIIRVGSGSNGTGTSNGSNGSGSNGITTPITNNYISRVQGEFSHDLDEWGYDALYGQRDYQSDVDIWTHIKEKIHPKHKEQQEYIDKKDLALSQKIEDVYSTRRSKKDIEKIIHDYYQDDIERIEGKSHQHGFDPIGDLVKNLTTILIIAGVAYVGYKSLPLLRRLI